MAILFFLKGTKKPTSCFSLKLRIIFFSTRPIRILYLLLSLKKNDLIFLSLGKLLLLSEHSLNLSSLKIRNFLKVREKYYVEDHGFREAVLANNNTEIQLILENIVYMEMISRGFNVTVGKYEEREIDFICIRNKEKLYLQVAYLLMDEATIKREISVYKKISDNYPKYVLSLDDFNFSREGIIHMNIIDFLCEG